MVSFRPAVKYESKLRLALIGPSGSGKTMTSLIIASRLAEHTGTSVAVIDTERGSASKYADQYAFDVLEMTEYGPGKYVEAIRAAQAAGYGVLVIDSLSHAWAGKGGALEMVDEAAARSKSGSSFSAWREVTPEHNRMVDAIAGAGMHVIVTMRSKMGYVQDTDDRGKTVIRKVGMQPVQRDGLEYEFDMVGDMDSDNQLVLSKSRCPELSSAVIKKPDGAVADTLWAWLQGSPAPVSVSRGTSTADAMQVIPPRADYPNTVKMMMAWAAADFGKSEEEVFNLLNVDGREGLRSYPGGSRGAWDTIVEAWGARDEEVGDAAEVREPAVSGADELPY